jgi:hypothetical protein
VVKAGFLVVLAPLDVRGFHLVRAHEGHAARPSLMVAGGGRYRVGCCISLLYEHQLGDWPVMPRSTSRYSVKISPTSRAA